MKVTISRDATELELDEVQLEQLKLAMQGRNPAHTIHFEDGSGVLVNTETGVTIKYSPADTAKISAEKMIPDPDPNADPDRTVAQLRAALDAAKVTYDKDAKKADLQELAKVHNV